MTSREPANETPYRLIEHLEFGANVIGQSFTNLYRCWIGDDVRIGPVRRDPKGAVIDDGCKIQATRSYA